MDKSTYSVYLKRACTSQPRHTVKYHDAEYTAGAMMFWYDKEGKPKISAKLYSKTTNTTMVVDLEEVTEA